MPAAAEAPAAQDAGAAGSSGTEGAACTRKVPSVHNIVVKFVDRPVLFHIMLLDGSFFLWVGDAGLSLDDLQVAVPTRFDPMPAVTTLRGDMDGPGSGLAQKLSKKFNRLIYLSYNLGAEPMAMLFVQKEATRILGELLANEV